MLKENGNSYIGFNSKKVYNLGYTTGYIKKIGIGIEPRFRQGRNRGRIPYGRGYNVLSYRRYIPLTYSEYKRALELIKPSKSERNNNINLKIEEIKSKIEEEIKSRRAYIKKYIRKDKKCFVVKIKPYYQLKKEFLNYLVEKSEHKLFKKRNLKKKLENIRFNLDDMEEDVFMNYDGIIIRLVQPKSLVDSGSSEWNELEKIIRLIGRNIKEFKLASKKEELKKLYTQYERMTFLNQEENLSICERCGSENLMKANFCHNCGNKL